MCERIVQDFSPTTQIVTSVWYSATLMHSIQCRLTGLVIQFIQHADPTRLQQGYEGLLACPADNLLS